MKVRFTKTVSMRNPSDPQPANRRQAGPVDVPITDIASIDPSDEGVVVINLKSGGRVLADLAGLTAIPIVQS